MASNSSPRHYYMVTALTIYVRDEQQKQRHMNVVLELPRKPISMQVIDNARRGVLERLYTELNVPVDGVLDVVFTAFNYLGVMSPEDFYDMPEPTEQPQH